MKVSSGIYQSVLGYADSITAASSAQSEMTGAPNKRQTSPDSGAQTAPTTHPAHERLSLEPPFSNSSFRTAFFQAPAPSSVPSRAPPLSVLLRAVPFGAALLRTPSFERPPSSVLLQLFALTTRASSQNMQEYSGKHAFVSANNFPSGQ